MNRQNASAAPRLLLLAVSVAGLGWSTSGFAATYDTFMKIDGVPGESVDRLHPGEIKLTSYSQNFGTRNCSRVVATKTLDSASPLLISRAAGNVWIPSVVISLHDPRAISKLDFFVATLTSVLIERIDLADQNGQLVEQIVLRPRSIKIEYLPLDPSGSYGAPVVTSVDCI